MEKNKNMSYEEFIAYLDRLMEFEEKYSENNEDDLEMPYESSMEP